MPHDRKPGRPALPAEMRRDAQVNVRFTREELFRVSRAAADRDETVAQFLRERVTASLDIRARTSARPRA